MRLIPPREILRRIWPSDGKIANPELVAPAYAARHQDATFIVFGNGPSLAENLDAIHALGEKFSAITIGANNIGEILTPDYHAFTNRKRFAAYAAGVDPERTRVLLSPYFTDGFIRKHYTGPYEQIMYRADNDVPFDIQNGIIQASCRTVAVLMIAVAVVMGARRIFVAGTDGYKGHLDSGRHVHFYDGDFGQRDSDGAQAKQERFLLELERYNARFMNEISAYMRDRGLEPFTIVTPTVHTGHYRPIGEYL